LWRAIIDYGRGNTYVLDPDTDRVRPKEVTDIGLPEAPTATRDEVSLWRHEFVDSLPRSTMAKFASELEEWAERGGGQTGLPRAVRGRWVEFIKGKVSEKLTEWFESQGRLPPEDMLLPAEARVLPPAEAIDEVVRTQQLRDLIISAIRTMTYDELSQIQLPAFALLRVSEHPTRKDG
jgi:hypothetical protein